MARMIECQGCGETKPTRRLGLCESCYRKQPPMALCTECGENKPHAARGLCRRCYGRNQARKNAKTIALNNRIKRALRGGLPRCKRFGHLNTNWRGGGPSVCSLCQIPLGWRQPRDLLKAKNPPMCSACRWEGHHRRPVYCAVCGHKAGDRYPSEIRVRPTGFRCEEHKGIKRLPYLPDQFCVICKCNVGPRSTERMRSNKTGFRCKEHRAVRLPRKDQDHERQQRELQQSVG